MDHDQLERYLGTALEWQLFILYQLGLLNGWTYADEMIDDGAAWLKASLAAFAQAQATAPGLLN